MTWWSSLAVSSKASPPSLWRLGRPKSPQTSALLSAFASRRGARLDAMLRSTPRWCVRPDELISRATVRDNCIGVNRGDETVATGWQGNFWNLFVGTWRPRPGVTEASIGRPRTPRTGVPAGRLQRPEVQDEGLLLGRAEPDREPVGAGGGRLPPGCGRAGCGAAS